MEKTTADHLLDRYASDRSEEAFAALVKAYGGLVLGTARQRLGEHQQWAEDVGQATFIALANQASEIRDGTHLAAWLHRVTCHAAKDRVRSETRRRNREKISHMASETNRNTEYSCLERELAEALDSLKADDRRLISLRYFENMNLRILGETLGTSEDAARKRINSALERLRSKLALRGVTCSASLLCAALAQVPVGSPVSLPLLTKWSVTAFSAAPATSLPPLINLLTMTTQTKLFAVLGIVTATALLSYKFIKIPGSGHPVEKTPETQQVSVDRVPRQAKPRPSLPIPATRDALLDRLREIFAIKNNAERSTKLIALLERLSPEQLGEAAKFSRDLALNDHGKEHRLIAAAWAKADLNGAIAFMCQLDPSDSPPFAEMRRRVGLDAVLHVWISSDPEAAMRWAAKRVEEDSNSMATVLSTVGLSGNDAVLQLVKKIDDGPTRVQAVAALCNSLIQENKPVDWILETAKEEGYADRVVEGLYGKLTPGYEPGSSPVAAMALLRDFPQTGNLGVIRNIYAGFMFQSEELTLEALETPMPADLQKMALSAVTDLTAWQAEESKGKDMKFFFKLLDRFPEVQNLDSGGITRLPGLMSALGNPPDLSSIELSTNIRDEERGEITAATIKDWQESKAAAREWLKNNPEWLKTNPLSDETIENLRKP